MEEDACQKVLEEVIIKLSELKISDDGLESSKATTGKKNEDEKDSDGDGPSGAFEEEDEGGTHTDGGDEPSTCKAIEENEEAHAACSSNKKTLLYFALALPEGTQSEVDLVFNDRKEALASMKSHKFSRFKAFSTKEEAHAFASTRLTEVTPMKDLASQGGGVTPQLLVHLRKIIENGDANSFLKAIFKNPRLLTGRTDIPSVLQEGTHLNALHIAAKCDKPIICQLLLDVLRNKQFLEKLYPQESLKDVARRTNQLLDLYINTPEKCLGETPLHYASKFGSLGCVKILVAHPLCIPNSKNVNGKTAEDIICSRAQVKASASFPKTDDFVNAFKNVYYVAILRSESLLSPPVITKPSLIRNIVFDDEGFNDEKKEPSASENLIETFMKINAFAGPMDMERACAFCQALKYPSIKCYEKEECKLLLQIKKSDENKGLERIARHLSEDLNTDFMEYHAFLNLFANFSKEEGLEVLESFFKNRNKNLYENFNFPSNAYMELEKALYVMPEAHINALGHIINVNLKRNECVIVPSLPVLEGDDKFVTPPSSPESDDYFSASDSLPGTPSLSPFKRILENFFIEGSKITRVDVDAYLSIQNKVVDKAKFPNVFAWKNRVEYKLREYQDDLQKMKTLTPLASVTVPKLSRLRQMETQIPGSASGVKMLRKKLF